MFLAQPTWVLALGHIPLGCYLGSSPSLHIPSTPPTLCLMFGYTEQGHKPHWGKQEVPKSTPTASPFALSEEKQLPCALSTASLL